MKINLFIWLRFVACCEFEFLIFQTTRKSYGLHSLDLF